MRHELFSFQVERKAFKCSGGAFAVSLFLAKHSLLSQEPRHTWPQLFILVANSGVVSANEVVGKTRATGKQG